MKNNDKSQQSQEQSATSHYYLEHTIAAIATPPGTGAIGIIRVSGPLSQTIAQAILKKKIPPKQVHIGHFHTHDSHPIDYGLALFFQAPLSYTGQDMLELHCHGNPVILDALLKSIYHLGARSAENGEFSKRAFLNNKIDLTQAEAIADIIQSDSAEAVHAAMNSLQGQFSDYIQKLIAQLTQLRVHAEVLIDFTEEADENLDKNEQQQFSQQLQDCSKTLDKIQHGAQSGHQLMQQINVVLLGAPNVGKSTLLNQLSGKNNAIVHNQPGTTRDILNINILIQGMKFQLTDTAGIRTSTATIDAVEKEGIRRAQEYCQQADHILWIHDEHEHQYKKPPHYVKKPYTSIANKCDLHQQPPGIENKSGVVAITLSAKNNLGIDLLRNHLWELTQQNKKPLKIKDTFSARARHLQLLKQVQVCLKNADTLNKHKQNIELIAEELRLAQDYLGQITGAINSDDLLGEIFNQFCIGK